MPGLPVQAPNGVPVNNSANYNDARLASSISAFLNHRQPAWTGTVVDFSPRPPTAQAPASAVPPAAESASGEVMTPHAGASAPFRGTGRPRGRPRKHAGTLPHVQHAAHDGTPQHGHENGQEEEAEEVQQQQPTYGQGPPSAQPQQAPQRPGRTAQTAAVLLSPAPSDEPSPAVSNSRESPSINHNAPAPSYHPVIAARFVHSLNDDNTGSTFTRAGNNGSAPTTPAVPPSVSPFLAHPQLPPQSTNAAASIPHSPAPQNQSLLAHGAPQRDGQGQGQGGHVNSPPLPLAPHPGERAAKRKRIDPSQPPPPMAYLEFRHVLRRYSNSPGVKDRIKAGTEFARFSLLDQACIKEDGFFLALHQIYCMWSSYAQNAYDILPEYPPHTIDEGLGIMEGLLKKNLTIQPMHRQFFENFPASINQLCEPPTAYNTAIRQVGRFLHLIGTSYGTFVATVSQRGYPYLVDELLSYWECYSPVLQLILFTACRRRIGVPDGHGCAHEIDRAFQIDQRNHAYLYQSGNLNPQFYQTWRNQQELEAQNAELITYYRSRVHQVRTGTGAAANGNNSIGNNSNTTPQNRRLSIQTTAPAATGPPMPNSAPPNQAAFTFSNATNPYSPVFSPGMEAFHNAYPTQNLPSAQHSPPSVHPSMVTSRSPQDLSNPAAQWQQQQLQQQRQQRPLYPQQGVQYPPHAPQQHGLQSMVITPQLWQQMQHEGALRRQQIPQQQQQHQPQHQLQQQQQPGNQRQQWVTAAMTAAANNGASAAQLYAARAQAQQQLQLQTTMPLAAQIAPVRPQQVQAQQNPQIQQQPQNVVPREPAPARTPDIPLVPPLGTTIHPSEYAYEASDRRSLLMALHQAHARSPRRTVVNGESERMYQAVKELVTKPTQLAENVRIYTVPFEVTDEQYRLRVMTDRRGVAIAVQPHQSLRWRIRCCRINNHQKGVILDETWRATQSNWPDIFISFNGNPLEIRRKPHFGKDLSIELTEMIVSGKNKVEAVIQNAPSPNFFIAVEMIETLRHSTIVDDVWKNRLIPESKTLQIIKDRLGGSGADDEVSVAVPYLSIDLTDPFSSVMFHTPVRGGACTHLECFDLETFLNTRQVSKVPCGHEGRACKCPPQPTSPDKWACPLSGCDKIASPYDLQIDGFLLKVRKELERTGRKPQYSKALHVEADGKWTVVVQDDDDDDDDSDGEDLEPRQKKIKTASATPAPAPSVAGSVSRRSGPPSNVEVIEIDDD
ncbi:hypothetical protein GE21DRAFT_8401 [Neurospora crassa]|uniref:Uncharacterized protein n=1 Tax=Neurospora crassa (strain ATCC 24698 / 74-OR23-1A / CBS 708.71 / DSM 1257 / FGSC 987) TaxID=367110 RepID=Q7S0G6_NEUCR|nr:hypothetical protein NCU09846 [Neurospora crassa OR74A]EAA28808.2 hypothetical protein NCU09846 [Neurospora crassa OR74A]KHE82041.1 hypothetical protein GE21DRAFT_8401 [Neurospora crassa]|eukprot:XP_958044.2 hypothetical protein NCU09846 [Neurospora crassa OR74A]